MNRFTVDLQTDTQYPNKLNKAPVLIVDRIKLTPKLLGTQIKTDAPMHLLKDISAQQLSKKIVDLMNHRSVSDLSSNLHYEEFSFTYAEKDELDILDQQLNNRTKDLYIAEDKLDTEIMKNEYLNKQIDIRNYIIAVLSIISTTLYILKYL